VGTPCWLESAVKTDSWSEPFKTYEKKAMNQERSGGETREKKGMVPANRGRKNEGGTTNQKEAKTECTKGKIKKWGNATQQNVERKEGKSGTTCLP